MTAQERVVAAEFRRPRATGVGGTGGVPHHSSPPATIVFVGGGPRTVGLLERFAASAPELR
jgi:hypothetical protein